MSETYLCDTKLADSVASSHVDGSPDNIPVLSSDNNISGQLELSITRPNTLIPRH